ncbi:MAG: HIRAN domain-containing protein [Acidobacteriota bacterium]
MHKAIERILPPDLRKQSKAVRTASELVTKERERGAATEQKQREREERERSGQQYNLNCMVMGVAYEDRGALIEKCLTISQAVFLVRETGNPFDHNAVLIRIPQGHIGYIPREYAEEIAQLLDKGYRQIAYCTKILQGKRFPIPVVQTYLYRPDSTMGIETPAPYPYRATENKPSQPARTSGSSCLGCALAAVVVVALMVLVLIMIFS